MVNKRVQGGIYTGACLEWACLATAPARDALLIAIKQTTPTRDFPGSCRTTRLYKVWRLLARRTLIPARLSPNLRLIHPPPPNTYFCNNVWKGQRQV